MSRVDRPVSLEKYERKKWEECDILVIDDDESRVRLLQEELQESGVRTVEQHITQATSLEGAVAILKAVIEKRRPAPDIIFLDHMFYRTHPYTEYAPLADEFLGILTAMQRSEKYHTIFERTRVVIFSNVASKQSHQEQFDEVVGEAVPPIIVGYVDPDGPEYLKEPQKVLEKIKSKLKKQGLIS